MTELENLKALSAEDPARGQRPDLILRMARGVLEAYDRVDGLATAMERLRTVLPDGDPLPDDHDPSEWLARQRFRTAGSQDFPHQYLTPPAGDDWVYQLRVVDLIRRTGTPETFRGVTYRYRTWGGWTYWASPPYVVYSPMSQEVGDSLLNRRRADRPAEGGPRDPTAPPEEPTLL